MWELFSARLLSFSAFLKQEYQMLCDSRKSTHITLKACTYYVQVTMQDAKEPIFPDWLKKNFILNTFLKVAFEELTFEDSIYLQWFRASQLTYQRIKQKDSLLDFLILSHLFAFTHFSTNFHLTRGIRALISSWFAYFSLCAWPVAQGPQQKPKQRRMGAFHGRRNSLSGSQSHPVH